MRFNRREFKRQNDPDHKIRFQKIGVAKAAELNRIIEKAAEIEAEMTAEDSYRRHRRIIGRQPVPTTVPFSPNWCKQPNQSKSP